VTRHHYRITKYDPALRTDRGAFCGNDWTSVSDIGDEFDGRRLTTSDYLAVEAAHLVTATAFAEESGVESLVVQSLNHGDGYREGQTVTLLEAAEVVRALLRETLDCALAVEDRFYIHVGYDYYMYVGSDRACPRSVRRAHELGLFVDEDFPSPQLPE
jgi:hypothetical protein